MDSITAFKTPDSLGTTCAPFIKKNSGQVGQFHQKNGENEENGQKLGVYEIFLYEGSTSSS